MTIRDAIDAALAARDVGTDPTRVLAEHGYPDFPAEAFSSALLHFAERAPLEVADALAPIVTRLSPVPFEPEDLPPSPADDLLDDGADAFTLFAEVAPAELDHLHDADPDGFDDDDATGPTGDEAGRSRPGADQFDDTPDRVEAEADDDPSFGQGHDDGATADDNDAASAGFDRFDDDIDGSDPFDDADLEPDEAFALSGEEADAFEPADQPAEEAEPMAEHMAELAEQMSDFRVELDRLAQDDHLDDLHFDD